jgi:hypothetical protein
VGPVGDRVVDRLHLGEHVQREPKRHDPAAGAHTRDTDGVVHGRRDRPRHVRAVPVQVARDGVAVVEVPAVHVVDEPVAVIVDRVAGDLPRVHPQVRRQIRVGRVDAGVDHSDDRAGRADGDVPGVGRVDVRVGDPGKGRRWRIADPVGLSRVAQAPELGEERVVRNGLEQRSCEIGLHGGDRVVAPIVAHRGLDVGAVGDPDQRHPPPGQAVEHPGPGGKVRRRTNPRGHAGPEAHDELAPLGGARCGCRLLGRPGGAEPCRLTRRHRIR